jgi:outer membrane lipoprotein-sorting protein
MKYCRLILILALLAVPVSVFAQMKADEVIRLMEKNEVHSTAKSTGQLLITNRFGTKTKTFNVVSQGNDKMLLEFTNKEERGQKILRLTDEIYVYYPKSNGVVRLQGGALKESIFGSDLTYEDLTGEKGILDLYKVEFADEGPVTVDGTPCYHLKLTGIVPVAYPFQELWVETTRFVTRKAIYFSLTNKPLKQMEVKATTQLKGKTFPTHFVMTDLLKKNSSTEFIIDNIQIDLPLDARQFTLERLKF